MYNCLQYPPSRKTHTHILRLPVLHTHFQLLETCHVLAGRQMTDFSALLGLSGLSSLATNCGRGSRHLNHSTFYISVMRNWILTLLWLRVTALFPGAEPDDGDVRHLYPYANIAIGLDTHAHALPYLLGWLENIEYPKDRLRLEFYELSKEDSTPHQLKWWLDATRKYFKAVKVVTDSTNWLEDALRGARLTKAGKFLILTGDTIPIDTKILESLFVEPKHVAITPFFRSIDDSFNVDDVSEELLERKIVREETSSASFPIAINLTSIDSSYLTFDSENIAYYDGPKDPLNVFEASAKRMNIGIMIDNQEDYGFYVNPSLDLEERRRILRYQLSDVIASGQDLPIVSRSVRPYIPEAEKWDVDRIYLINLKRRPERLERMKKIFELLGVSYKIFEAVDGAHLDTVPNNYKILDGYLDPVAKRPIKNGEIGCFLSHFRIWEDVVQNNFKRVIVFEDDLRFAPLGLEKVKEVLQDLDGSQKSWDLIYLGRKKQAADQEELWVPYHRHLSTVGYSYWTLGYLLSGTGAGKLLNARPLEKLLPVDEFLPLMYGKHPVESWNKQFPRNLEAFTMYPLVVYPQRYTYEDGYVSDTENSSLAPEVLNVKDEL